MSFSEMMKELQKREEGRIIFCNAGEFYVAIGKDAVLLNQILGLNVSCFKAEICKIGFPIQSLEKYIELVIKERYGFVIYNFDKEKRELIIVESYIGKKI